MRKNILALSMAAGLAFAGSAHAVTDIGVAANAANDGPLTFSSTGVGNILLVPYFSTQAGNATLLSIVNTSDTVAKAVKVRFRGASNSDDIFDFQVFLSPNDVWTANISRGEDGRSALSTSDNSCTKPANVNRSFITDRLNSDLTGDALANETREGYIEILNMADINDAAGADLFDAVLHDADGVAPCSGTAWTGLDVDRDYATLTAAPYLLSEGSGGLMANWTIVNLATAAAYGSSATAIAGGGAVVYYPQTANAITGAASAHTADPALTSGAVDIALYDLPDLSTPYFATAGVGATPDEQAVALTESIAVTSVMNEYLTDAAVQASTDWVFSMPTRRYAVAVDYSVPEIVANPALAAYFEEGTNVDLVNGQICVAGITVTTYNREEATPADPSDVVISPGTPTAPRTFCGETSVFAINGTGTSSALLGASVALNNVDAVYNEGWLRVATPGANALSGLPILGGAFVRAISGSSNFGVNWDHKFVRAIP